MDEPEVRIDLTYDQGRWEAIAINLTEGRTIALGGEGPDIPHALANLASGLAAEAERRQQSIDRAAVRIHDHEWEEAGTAKDLRAHLVASGVTINGCPMHVEAWAVKMVRREPDGLGAGGDFQTTVERESDEAFGHLWPLTNADGPFQTVEIEGRAYVLVATPHA